MKKRGLSKLWTVRNEWMNDKNPTIISVIWKFFNKTLILKWMSGSSKHIGELLSKILHIKKKIRLFVFQRILFENFILNLVNKVKKRFFVRKFNILFILFTKMYHIFVSMICSILLYIIWMHWCYQKQAAAQRVSGPFGQSEFFSHLMYW